MNSKKDGWRESERGETPGLEGITGDEGGIEVARQRKAGPKTLPLVFFPQCASLYVAINLHQSSEQ